MRSGGLVPLAHSAVLQVLGITLILLFWDKYINKKTKKVSILQTLSRNFTANQPFNQHTADTYRFPAERNVSRPYKHRIEVVVKDQDSPVDEHKKVDAAPCSVKRPVPNDWVQNRHGGTYSNDRQCYNRTPVAQSPNLMEVLERYKSWQEVHVPASGFTNIQAKRIMKCRSQV